MAILALGLLGGAAGGAVSPVVGTAIGGWLGALAGSYIDNAYLFPAIFPADKVRRSDLADISPQQNNEGAAAYLCIGPKCRVPGTIIWRGGLQKSNQTPSSGKGSTASVTGGLNYFVSLAIAWHVGDQPIEAIEEIRAEGKTIWLNATNIDVDSNLLSVTRYETYRWNNATDATALSTVYMDIKSPAGGPDLSKMRSGKDATIAGFTNGGNNGTFRVLFSDADTGTGETRVRLRNPGCVTEGATGSVKSVDQTLPSQQFNFADEIVQYLGTDTQAVDSEIEADQGVGNVPAFRGIAYTRITRLKLNEFGNRIPQFVALVRQSATKAISSTIGDVLRRAGYASSEYDVSGVSGSTQGVVIAGPTTTQQILMPLLSAYNVGAKESAGKLVFRDRESLAEVAIPEADLGAHPWGESPQSLPIDVDDPDPETLPREVVVNYLDPFNDEQDGSQSHKNRVAPGDQVIQARFPLVMNAQEAVALATRLLWTSWANSQRIRLTLPPSHLPIEEGDILTFPADGENYRALVLRIDKSFSHVLRIEAVREVANTLTFPSAPAEAPPQQTRTSYIPPECRVEILDTNAFRSQDVDDPGVYWATAAFDPVTPFDRVHLYLASNAALSNWTAVQSMRQEATLGEVIGTVPSGPWQTWDLATTIDVELYHGSLSSSNDTDVLNQDANHALIGDEVVGFVTVTPLGGRKYRLSRLLRGRAGSERWRSRHAQNERFILLTEQTIQNKNKNRSHRGRTFGWEGVPHGGTQGDFALSTYPTVAVFESNRFRCYAPVNLRAAGGASLDYFLYWNPRYRFPDPVLSPGNVGGSSGQFRVQLWSGDPETGGTLLSTNAHVDTPGLQIYNFYMSAAVHTIAGLALGDPHWVTVAEWHPDYYLGYGLRSEALFVDLP